MHNSPLTTRVNGERENAFIRQSLRQLLRKQDIRRLDLRVRRQKRIPLPSVERRIVQVNGPEHVVQTRDDHKARGIGRRASGEDAWEDGFDEEEVGEVADCELVLVAFCADAVLSAHSTCSVCDNHLRYLCISS